MSVSTLEPERVFSLGSCPEGTGPERALAGDIPPARASLEMGRVSPRPALLAAGSMGEVSERSGLRGVPLMAGVLASEPGRGAGSTTRESDKAAPRS